MEELKRDFSVLYICASCDKATAPPTHCGKAMKLEEIDGLQNWICWKGAHPPCCGRESLYLFVQCCENSKPIPKIQTLLS